MLNAKYERNFELYSLVNGYRRFDPSRGIDYKLDIALRRLDTGDLTQKR